MTRDDVLKEFYATPTVPGGSSDRMADEIVRLRKALDEHDTARMTAELLLERERRTSDSHFGMSVMYEKEYERARDILAALREPSEAVVKAVKDAIYEELGIDYWDGKTRRILYYAVAAAEQEVRHDER